MIFSEHLFSFMYCLPPILFTPTTDNPATWPYARERSLNETRSLFYIKVHEAKKTLIKDIGPVNRVYLTVLVSVENIYLVYRVIT